MKLINTLQHAAPVACKVLPLTVRALGAGISGSPNRNNKYRNDTRLYLRAHPKRRKKNIFYFFYFQNNFKVIHLELQLNSLMSLKVV